MLPAAAFTMKYMCTALPIDSSVYVTAVHDSSAQCRNHGNRLPAATIYTVSVLTLTGIFLQCTGAGVTIESDKWPSPSAPTDEGTTELLCSLTQRLGASRKLYAADEV